MVYGAFFLPHTDSKKNFKSQFQTNNRYQIVTVFCYGENRNDFNAKSLICRTLSLVSPLHSEHRKLILQIKNVTV